MTHLSVKEKPSDAKNGVKVHILREKKKVLKIEIWGHLESV